eukprot:GHVP01032665.1.p1 GENE.GHVP01032665.1~~GHVP01032665.1.p1  ORF type:complete len:362 (+),score=44.64 GHVP01032665.1:16-1101(+)
MTVDKKQGNEDNHNKNKTLDQTPSPNQLKMPYQDVSQPPQIHCQNGAQPQSMQYQNNTQAPHIPYQSGASLQNHSQHGLPPQSQYQKVPHSQNPSPFQGEKGGLSKDLDTERKEARELCWTWMFYSLNMLFLIAYCPFIWKIVELLTAGETGTQIAYIGIPIFYFVSNILIGLLPLQNNIAILLALAFHSTLLALLLTISMTCINTMHCPKGEVHAISAEEEAPALVAIAIIAIFSAICGILERTITNQKIMTIAQWSVSTLGAITCFVSTFFMFGMRSYVLEAAFTRSKIHNIQISAFLRLSVMGIYFFLPLHILLLPMTASANREGKINKQSNIIKGVLYMSTYNFLYTEIKKELPSSR